MAEPGRTRSASLLLLYKRSYTETGYFRRFTPHHNGSNTSQFTIEANKTSPLTVALVPGPIEDTWDSNVYCLALEDEEYGYLRVSEEGYLSTAIVRYNQTQKREVNPIRYTVGNKIDPIAKKNILYSFFFHIFRIYYIFF